jgi:hypothetical protein
MTALPGRSQHAHCHIHPSSPHGSVISRQRRPVAATREHRRADVRHVSIPASTLL